MCVPDFRVAETAAFDEKLIAAGNAAVGLWTRTGAWCMHNLTDGFVPKTIALSVGSQAQVNRLITSGLWEHAEGGFQFVKFLKHQRSKEQVEAEKTAARERMKRIRSGERSGERSGSGSGERSGGSSGERSAHVRDSLPFPSLSGTSSREANGYAHAREKEPPSFCDKHPTGTDAKCGGCKHAREARAAWQRETLHAESEARSADARARATVRAQAIAACGMCDSDGYAHGSLCDHDTDTTARAERGRALVEAALRKEPTA